MQMPITLNTYANANNTYAHVNKDMCKCVRQGEGRWAQEDGCKI